MYKSENLSRIILKLENSENPLSNRIAKLLSSKVGKELIDSSSPDWGYSSIQEKVMLLKHLNTEGVTIDQLFYAFKEVFRDNPHMIDSAENALLRYLLFFISSPS